MSDGKRRTLTGALVAFAVAALVIPLSGCGALTDDRAPQPERDENTQEIIERGDADAFALLVGDCMNEVAEDLVSVVPVVPCDRPHDEEVYFALTLEGDDYPGDDVIRATSDEACLAQFERFVGMAYESSTLGFYGYRPSRESWEQLDDRTVSCVIYDPAGKVTGTLEGVAR